MENPLSNPVYRRLPPEAVILLRQVSAPPRLVAHLIVVHDVASSLVERICEAFPRLALDREAVLFGASIHDLGKSIYRSELVEPGKEHEKRGVELLRGMGVSEDRARFAFTHGNWGTAENITLEDLVVALADNCWKGKRVDELEARAVELLSSASGKPAWICFADLDEILEYLAQGADERLAWQGAYSTQPTDSDQL
jgi:putative nucleotidyltransferase with HDIG domain